MTDENTITDENSITDEKTITGENTMTDENTMEEFMDQIDSSMKRVQKGDILEGKVIAVNEEEIIVNIGYIADGVIKKEELVANRSTNIEDAIKVDDVIKVYVLRPQDDEGNVVLSQKRAEQIVVWDELEAAFEEKTKIKVLVKDVVKGGVTAYYKSVRCFIPGSLLSHRYVSDMNTYVDKELVVKVEDFDIEKKRVILSRKTIEVEEREKLKEALYDTLVIGEKRKGTVTKLMKFGAFVDIGGTEGLIHLNDLAWYRVNDPAEIVSEGDEVEVYILSFDKKTGKIGLGLKNVDEDPWKGIAEYYSMGDVVEGKVIRLMPFGAFVEIENGIEGLVHISEISTERIAKPEDVLKVGQDVEVMVLSIDEKNKKISLSIKEAEGSIVEDIDMGDEEEQTSTLGDLFGDKLKDMFK